MKRFQLAIVVSALVFVAPAMGMNWKVPADFGTIQDAIDSPSVVDGDTIEVAAGTYAGAVVTKAVKIKGKGKGKNNKTVINDGPNSHSILRAGFLFNNDGSGSGAQIEGFQFVGVSQFAYVDDGALDFPVFSRGADNVTVSHNTIVNSLQAITNWNGNGWTIDHNEIVNLWTLNGGGIGILVGSNDGGIHGGNEVSHNKIRGTLSVWPADGGGYNGTGIVIFADWRYGNTGAVELSGNRAHHNKIDLLSDTPGVVDVAAIELTESGNPGGLVIIDNEVKHNKFECMALQIELSPAELADFNFISKNKGKKKCD